MSVAVITPFFKTPLKWLEQCLLSVERQTFPCTHFLVCDGDAPIGVPLSREVQVIRLPKPHHDVGNAARAIGSVSAICQGYDAIAYLDADNWYEPYHVEKLWRAHQESGSAVCTSGRNLADLEGQLLGLCPEVDGDRFVDTNCMFLSRGAFPLIATWYLMPRGKVEMGDRLVWRRIKESGVKRIHLSTPTVWYRTSYETHYRHFGKEPPRGAKPTVKERVPPVSAAIRVDSPHSSQRSVIVSNAGKPSNGAVPPACAPLPPAATPQSISLCMIVRNEEANLGDCLASVVDMVDEIVVVDTGSTDATKEVAKRYGAKVVDFPWIDDFAAARNVSIDHATSDWIFWMDADDRLDEANREKSRRLKAILPEENCVYLMKQWSPPDRANGSPLTVDHVRLFRRRPEIRWQYRVHEQILPSAKAAKARIAVTDLVIQHLGYKETALRRRKAERNLNILLMELKEKPDDAFVHFNLGGSYPDLGQVDKAMPHLEACIRRALKGASFLPKAFMLLVGTLRQSGQIEKATAWCAQAREQFPKDVDLLFEEGMLCEVRKDPRQAQECFETILSMPRGTQYVGTEEGVFGHLSRHHLAMALWRQGQMAKAEKEWRRVIKESPSFAPGWLALIEILLDQKQWDEAEKLIADSEQADVPGHVTAAIKARMQLAHKKPEQAFAILEEALIRFPANQWLRILLVEMMLREGSASQRAEAHLHEILKHDPGHRQAQTLLSRLRSKVGST